MQKFNLVVQDNSGNAIPLADVFIYAEGTTTTVDIYEDDEVTIKSNPLSSGSDGIVNAMVPSGTYDIKIEKGAFVQNIVGLSLTDYARVDERLIVGSLKEKAFLNTTSSGLVSGGEITINADPTKYDIAEGIARFVDNSDPENPTITELTFGPFTAVTPTGLASQQVTFLAINPAGAIAESSTAYHDEETRTLVSIGSVVHPNLTNITGFSDFTHAPIIDTSCSLSDLSEAIGAVNLNGNVISGDPAGNLQFAKTAGKMFFMGIQYKLNKLNPNNISTAASIAPTMLLTWRDGVGGFNSANDTVVVAGVFDDDTGGASNPAGVLTSNRYTNHRLYYSPDVDLIILHYGQTSYGSESAALLALETETMDVNPILNIVPLRGWVTIRGGATDLTNLGDAVFTQASKFGISSPAGGNTSSIVTLQNTYENGAEPEILTNSIRNALTVRRGSAADTDNIYEGQKNDATITFAVTGNGKVSAASMQLGGDGATPTEFSTDVLLAGNSDTAIPTEKAVKTYVDAAGGGGGVFSNSFAPADQVFTNGSTVTLAHGLPSAPHNVSLEIVCKVAQQNWQVGDVLNPTGYISNTSIAGFGLEIDTTNIIVHVGSTGFIIGDKNNRGIYVVAGSGNWNIRIRAEA